MILWEALVLGLHILGAAIWVGGSVALGVVAVYLARRAPSGGPESAETTAGIARAMGRVMWPALAVTVVTGGINLSWYLPSGADLWTLPQTPWLLAKFAAVAVTIVAAALHSFHVGPAIRELRRRGAGEEALAPLRSLSQRLGALSAAAAVAAIFLAAILGSF